MKLWNNPKFVEKTPLLTNLLFEGANLHQLWQIWSRHSAAGHSVFGWLQVHMGLWLWWNFYRVVTPNQKWARISVSISILVNALLLLTVIYFNWIRQ